LANIPEVTASFNRLAVEVLKLAKQRREQLVEIVSQHHSADRYQLKAHRTHTSSPTAPPVSFSRLYPNRSTSTS
jgi:hypothetical protein